MKNLKNRVAAITGAGSGIGRALALDLAGRGTHLALSDVNEAGLAETLTLVKTSSGVDATSAHVDVAERQQVDDWAGKVIAEHGRVNLIINNAGVALGATVENSSYEDMEWLMGINFWGVVYGTKAFLPHLKAAGEGHIVNVSSVFGLLGMPTQSAYNAAKFAVRGFTESLRLELDAEGCGVSATVVHPGGIKTNIAKNARMTEAEVMGKSSEQAIRDFEKLLTTPPEAAAAKIVKAIQQDRRRVMIGADGHALAMLSKLPPAVYQRLISAGAKRQ